MTEDMDKITNGEVRALLFDFNGVIVDDEPIHFEASQRILNEFGIRISRQEYDAEFLGLNDRECLDLALTRYFRKAFSQSELEEIVQRKSRYYSDLVGDNPPFVPGSIEFIKEASGRFRLAIVSGALRKDIEHTLSVANLSSLFPVIISADDVKSSKPDPEGFNLAIARLDSTLTPSECVVIEDSARGIRAAKRAGTRCLALTTTLDRSALIEADWTLDGFPSFTALPWKISQTTKL